MMEAVGQQRLTPQMAVDMLCPAEGAAMVFTAGELVAHRVSGKAAAVVVAAILDRSDVPLVGALASRRAVTRNLTTGRAQACTLSEWRLATGEISVWVVGEVDLTFLGSAAAAITVHQQQARLRHPELISGGHGHFVRRRVIAARGETNAVALELRRVVVTAAHERGLIVHEEEDQTYVLDEESGLLLSRLRTITGLSLGLSAPMTAGQTAFAAREQADIALAAACQSGSPIVDAGTLEGWLVCADKVAFDAIAASPLAAQDPLSDLDQDLALLTTLRTNLSNPGRPKETSATLMLHVNSLRYRLRKAEGILGISADDPRLKHALRVSELFAASNTLRPGLPRSA